MMRTVWKAAACTLLALCCGLAQDARAGGIQTYLSLGDSIGFGETVFMNNPACGSYSDPSNGDRGFVAMYANSLASRYGYRPNVINLAVDGETSSTFTTGVGRVPPGAGFTDASLAELNTSLHRCHPADPGLSPGLDHHLRGGGRSRYWQCQYLAWLERPVLPGPYQQEPFGRPPGDPRDLQVKLRVASDKHPRQSAQREHRLDRLLQPIHRNPKLAVRCPGRVCDSAAQSGDQRSGGASSTHTKSTFTTRR